MALLGQRRVPEGASWVRQHSLSLVLVALLLAQAVALHLTYLPQWRAMGAHMGLWPGYWGSYATRLLTTLIGDTYGALLLVLGTKWFYERQSREADDPPEE